MDDLVVWLRERVAARRAQAERRDEDYRTDPESWHTRSCGYGQGELMEDCDCEVPAAVLDLCAAHTALLDAYEQVKAKSAEHSQRFVANLRVGKHIYTEEYQEERRQGWEHAGRRWGMDLAVLTVAAAYRRDQGYQEEWARWAGIPAEDEEETRG